MLAFLKKTQQNRSKWGDSSAFSIFSNYSAHASLQRPVYVRARRATLRSLCPLWWKKRAWEASEISDLSNNELHVARKLVRPPHSALSSREAFFTTKRRFFFSLKSSLPPYCEGSLVFNSPFAARLSAPAFRCGIARWFFPAALLIAAHLLDRAGFERESK